MDLLWAWVLRHARFYFKKTMSNLSAVPSPCVVSSTTPFPPPLSLLCSYSFCCIRRYPWSIPWLARAFPYWRQFTWYKLSFHGWLCGSWLLFGWNCDLARGSKGAIQGSCYHSPRQPWISSNHSSLWLLWWMLKEIRQCQCMEDVHWSFWLSALDCSYWRSGNVYQEKENQNGYL